MADLIGNTPLVELRGLRRSGSARVFLKLEGSNPTGSLKDRTALSILLEAELDGRLCPGATLLDASSGNFACSMAFLAAALGLRAKVVVSSKITHEKRTLLDYYDAEVKELGHFTIEGNRWCRDHVAAGAPDVLFLDQLHNPANPLAHYRTTGPEILKGLPAVTAIVGSLGSGGTVAGVSRFFKERASLVRIVGVKASKGSRIPGTGSFDDGDYVTPFITKAQKQGCIDEIRSVGWQEASDWCECLKGEGMFCGIQTGGVAAIATELANELGDEAACVVAISGDAGWKGMATLEEYRSRLRTTSPRS